MMSSLRTRIICTPIDSVQSESLVLHPIRSSIITYPPPHLLYPFRLGVSYLAFRSPGKTHRRNHIIAAYHPIVIRSHYLYFKCLPRITIPPYSLL